jgi:hypothetical protein
MPDAPFEDSGLNREGWIELIDQGRNNVLERRTPRSQWRESQPMKPSHSAIGSLHNLSLAISLI